VFPSFPKIGSNLAEAKVCHQKIIFLLNINTLEHLKTNKKEKKSK